MKNRLSTANYRLVLLGFEDWLKTLGYSKVTVYQAPRYIKEFLCYLESNNITNITECHLGLPAYLEYFKNRPNKRKEGGLSVAHINKQIDSLNKFFKYLNLTEQNLNNIKLQQLKNEASLPIYLTKEEIEELCKVTDNSLLGIRDRAMLGLYYGCGLRKSEGLSLKVEDILFDRRLVYVKHTKNNYERYVPISIRVLQDLESYIYRVRPILDNGAAKDALLLTEIGNPMKTSTPIYRLKKLQKATDNPELQDKEVGIHTLRHSIATHLLQAGMELEQISLFLGHKTLDSTQIYTHITQEI